MINTKELSEYLKIHENTIYKLVRNGMPCYRIGPTELRFELDEVKQWLRERSKEE